VATGCWVVANYLVNMTFLNKGFAAHGSAARVTFPPQSFDQFANVFSAGFGVMDVVFLAIMVWEAWKIPRPLVLPRPASGGAFRRAAARGGAPRTCARSSPGRRRRRAGPSRRARSRRRLAPHRAPPGSAAGGR